jgi:hypothetical protein
MIQIVSINNMCGLNPHSIFYVDILSPNFVFLVDKLNLHSMFCGVTFLACNIYCKGTCDDCKPCWN